MRESLITINNLMVYHNNAKSVEQTIDEVFYGPFYHFISPNSEPFIIDAGSNVGISCLFFKKLNPNAEILCFEPDPNSFSFLEKNVSANKLEKVKLIKAALSNSNTISPLYGQVSNGLTDARGNSLISEWGLQRSSSGSISVNCVRLSDYIIKEVDLLKIDIEGSEELVLKELGDKLDMIKCIIGEIHVTEKIRLLNDPDRIKKLLVEHNFDVEIKEAPPVVFPKETTEWGQENNPKLYTLKAKQKDT